MRFLDVEKVRMQLWKQSTRWLSDGARADGMLGNRSYAFALPEMNAHENLFEAVRDAALEYFEREDIAWHNGAKGVPSGHLCDGQVCCINFLLPFGSSGAALIELFRTVLPDAEEALPVDQGQLVSFEWIGLKNYLGEHSGGRIASDEGRTRGRFFHKCGRRR